MKNRNVSVSLSEALYEKLTRMAERTRRSRASVLSLLIENATVEDVIPAGLLAPVGEAGQEDVA